MASSSKAVSLRPPGTVSTETSPGISYPVGIRKAASYIVIHFENQGLAVPKPIFPYLYKILSFLTPEELKDHRSRGLPVKYNLERSVTQVKNYIKNWCISHQIDVVEFLKTDSPVHVPDAVSPACRTFSLPPVHRRANTPVHRRAILDFSPEDYDPSEINTLPTDDHRFISEVDSQGDVVFEEADTGITVRPSTSATVGPHTAVTSTGQSTDCQLTTTGTHEVASYQIPGALMYRSPTAIDETDDKSTIYDSSSHYSSSADHGQC